VIIDLVIQGLATLLTSLVGLLPASSVWTPDVSGLAGFIGHVRGTDAYLPVTETVACFVLALAIGKIQFAWAGAMWLYRRVRG
jgi:hypothetical protein